MLDELLVQFISYFWKLLTMVLTGIFTKQTIPIIIFFVMGMLFAGLFLGFKVKYHLLGKSSDPAVPPRFTTVCKIFKWAALTSFILSMITVGVASKGLAVDTLNQSVNIMPTGDYVIVGIGEDIGGQNLVICPLPAYYAAQNDTTGNKAWIKTRFAHFIPEQLNRFDPEIGMEITVALVAKNMRVFERLQQLPGDEDDEESDDGTTYGMIDEQTDQ